MGQIQVWPRLLSGSVGHLGQWCWPNFNHDTCTFVYSYVLAIRSKEICSSTIYVKVISYFWLNHYGFCCQYSKCKIVWGSLKVIFKLQILYLILITLKMFCAEEQNSLTLCCYLEWHWSSRNIDWVRSRCSCCWWSKLKMICIKLLVRNNHNPYQCTTISYSV